MAMLEVNNLSKLYTKRGKTVCALQDVSLRVAAGEFAVVQGPSGSGKTTLLLTVGGLLAPTSGSVSIQGQNPYALSPERRARFCGSSIGFVFQQFHLVPYLNVERNILVPSIAVPSDQAWDRARALMDRFQLSDRAQHVPSELSTGERQRVALARALLNTPKILLADEPTGNLDAENAEIVLRYLAEFAEHGGSVLLVTHDGRSTRYAGKSICLHAGHIVSE